MANVGAGSSYISDVDGERNLMKVYLWKAWIKWSLLYSIAGKVELYALE